MPRPTPLRRRFVAAVAAAVVAAAGCTGSDNSSGDTQELEPVTYLTGFQAAAHDSFIFLAKERGYFEEVGIDLTIQLGKGGQNYASMLAGEAQFANIDFTDLLIYIGRGDVAPGDFQALNAIMHSTVAGIAAPVGSGITSPADLEGKKIGAFEASPTFHLMEAYAELAGWEFDPGLRIGTTPQELFGLLAGGRVDAIDTFMIEKGVVEAAVGKEVRLFPYNEYLDDMMGTGIITTSTFAEENPDLAARFRDAALKGVKETLAHPEDAIAAMQVAYPNVVESPEPLVAQIGLMGSYVTSEGEDRIGVIDEARVVRCIAVLQSYGLATADMTPEAILGSLTLREPPS